MFSDHFVALGLLAMGLDGFGAASIQVYVVRECRLGLGRSQHINTEWLALYRFKVSFVLKSAALGVAGRRI